VKIINVEIFLLKRIKKSIIKNNKIKEFSVNKKVTEPQFIVNDQGRRVGVILDIKLYDALNEELEDLHDTLKAERRLAKTKKFYTLEEVEKKLLKQRKK